MIHRQSAPASDSLPASDSGSFDSTPKRLPVVLVTSCLRSIDDHPFEVAGQKYLNAVRLAGCIPLVVPAAQAAWLDQLLEMADGLLLTGSPSNVHPSLYGDAIEDPSLLLDAGRDAWVLPFVRRALSAGLPLFGICRGAQEVNVALGGSLYQSLTIADAHEGPYGKHQVCKTDTTEQQYGASHRVDVVPHGKLDTLLSQRDFMVNSLHDQGIRELAPGLRPEAVAPDGLVEAFSLAEARGFNLCVQWHPEWKAEENAVSLALFQAFGAACREYARLVDDTDER